MMSELAGDARFGVRKAILAILVLSVYIALGASQALSKLRDLLLDRSFGGLSLVLGTLIEKSGSLLTSAEVAKFVWAAFTDAVVAAWKLSGRQWWPLPAVESGLQQRTEWQAVVAPACSGDMPAAAQ